MPRKATIKGVDVPLSDLVPLNERRINLDKCAGYRKILASIKAIGLIEPLFVHQDGDRYVILDGYLRYKACQQLGIETVPCMVKETKEGYSYNRMVNKLSAFQEMRMLRRALEFVDEQEIADTLGMKSIKHRLSPTLLQKLHRDVAKAFQRDQISLTCVREFTLVKPERQAEIIKEMHKTEQYTRRFLRALILKTDPADRAPGAVKRISWTRNKEKQKELVVKLQEAESKHDFYTKLYRQYTTDLLKLMPYIRKIVTNQSLAAYLEEHHPAAFADFASITLDASHA